MGQVADETLVEPLPAFGRNLLAFSTLAPNVSFVYEGFDINSGSVATGSFGVSNLVRVPTHAERQGDCSGLVSRFTNDPNVLPYNPFTTRFDADGNSIRDRVVNNDTALQRMNQIWPVSN